MRTVTIWSLQPPSRCVTRRVFAENSGRKLRKKLHTICNGRKLRMDPGQNTTTKKVSFFWIKWHCRSLRWLNCDPKGSNFQTFFLSASFFSEKKRIRRFLAFEKKPTLPTSYWLQSPAKIDFPPRRMVLVSWKVRSWPTCWWISISSQCPMFWMKRLGFSNMWKLMSWCVNFHWNDFFLAIVSQSRFYRGGKDMHEFGKNPRLLCAWGDWWSGYKWLGNFESWWIQGNYATDSWSRKHGSLGCPT